MFSFAIPKFASGFDESFQGKEGNKYDNLLALDKGSYKELTKLERKLDGQKKKLEKLEFMMSLQRKSK
jgi:hypothetical protein